MTVLSNERILGFDIGLHFGWAVLDMAGERLDSGVWELTGSNHEGGGYRLLRLESYLHKLITIHNPKVVGYELVRRRPEKSGVEAGHIYGELRGILKKVLEDRGVPFGPIEVGHIKKCATNKGNASKEKVTDAAEVRWSITAKEDEADALWCAEVMRLKIAGEPISKFEAWLKRENNAAEDVF